VFIAAANRESIGYGKHPHRHWVRVVGRPRRAGADIVALANAGADTVNAIKQAHEFGVGTAPQRLVAFYLSVLDVKGLGLAAAAGTVLTEGFYWDIDDGTRAFSQRFLARHGAMPSQIQAGLYSAVRHYLKAVAASNSADARTVIRKMHALPIADDVVRHAELRPDGRMVHDYYVFNVKQPSEAHGPWDLYTLLDTIPGNEAFRPVAAGGCPRLLH